MADLTICLCHFEPPFAEALFHPSHLDLLLEEINLGAQGLALLVHGPILVDFGHKTPIVAGELVEHAADHGKGGPASHQSGQEPPWQGPCRVILILIIVFFGGKEVGDEREVSWHVILGVPGHFPPIQLFDPFSGAALPVFAGQVEVDFSLVFFIAWWGFVEGSLRVNPSHWGACSLEVVKGFFEEPFFDGMSVLHLPGSLHH